MIRVAPVAAASVAALALLAASPARAESTRVLRAEVPAGAKGFTVENLAGRMRVRSGSSDKTVVTATVYGETEALAAKFRLENVGTPEAPVLRVRYPEGESSVRYRSPNATDDHGFLNGIFESFDGTYTYDGRRMNVRNHRSKLMYADVEVEVARGETDAVIHNTVGLLSVADLSGRIRVEVSSSDIRLDRLKGEVRIQGSSGDIQAHEISGTWASEFSSGDVLLEGLKGDSARIETSSGDVRLRSVDVGRLELRSSSGDFKRRRRAAAAPRRGVRGEGDSLLGRHARRVRRRDGDDRARRGGRVPPRLGRNEDRRGNREREPDDRSALNAER
jgi:hypothetical protein